MTAGESAGTAQQLDLSRLAELFSAECPAVRHSRRTTDRIAYARDCWPLFQIRTTAGKVEALPDLIVWPNSTEQVAQVHQFALRYSVPLVPFGAGSGVCGGAWAARGGIILDLKRLDQILEIDRESRICRVQAGKNGQLYEEQLNQQGLSGGHFPSSIYCSTVGGWVAARGAGQCSTQYGKIEDMLVGATWVKPDGTIRTLSLEDGPDALGMLDLLTGSEGTLGTLTELELRVVPLPETRRFAAFMAPSVEAGVALIRRVIQEGALPSVYRMYDPLDTILIGREGKDSGESQPSLKTKVMARIKAQLHPLIEKGERAFLQDPSILKTLLPLLSARCLVIFMVEGSAEKTDWELDLIESLGRKLECESLGDGPGWTWHNHRYHVSYKQSKVYKLGAFVDTMEISAPYERLPSIYHAVVAELRGSAVVMAHFSHAYRDGGSIYFTFAAARDNPQDAESLYLELWRKALDTVLRLGGSLSHHHGVGVHKARWMAPALKGALPLTQAVKDGLDPAGYMNPGKLGLV